MTNGRRWEIIVVSPRLIFESGLPKKGKAGSRLGGRDDDEKGTC